MKGLVTVFGGSGFVGQQIVRALARQGWRLRIAVRRPGLAYRLPMLGDVGQVELMQANIRNQASVDRALEGAEACVNAVGQGYEKGPQTFTAVHEEGARAVAETAAAKGVRQFVLLSGIGADEASPSRYARARGAGERVTREVFPNAVVLRPSVVFGQGDHVFNSLARAATMSPVMPLFGAGETKLAPVYVADVAAAVAAVLSRPDSAGKTYELGGPATYTLRELNEMVLREIRRERPLVVVPFEAAELLGKVFELGSAVIAPPLTSDQVQMLRTDNVPSPDLPGLRDLGVTPTALEPILPGYLYPYRKGGQYAELTEAAQR